MSRPPIRRRPKRRSRQPAGSKVPTASREKDGVKLELDYCTTTRQYRADTLSLAASQLSAIGMNVNPLVKPVAARRLRRLEPGPGRTPPATRSAATTTS